MSSSEVLLNLIALEHRFHSLTLGRARPRAAACRTKASHAALAALLAVPLALGLNAARAQPGPAASEPAAEATAATILDARDALVRHDKQRLAAARAAAIAERNPLAMWADYWELMYRIGEVQQPEVDAFYARWSGTYVEDRLRNDWLLELGRRQDWHQFAIDYPMFRMQDDRQVACYALAADLQSGKEVATDAARDAWLAQKDGDDGCALLARLMVDAKRFNTPLVWHRARLAMDGGRLRAVRQATELIGADAVTAFDAFNDSSIRYLAKRASTSNRTAAELTTLALQKLANNDFDGTVRQMNERWDKALPADLAAWVWASLGRIAAQRLDPQAPDLFQRAEQRLAIGKVSSASETRDTAWSDETLAWKVRAALRASAGVGLGITEGAGRWLQVVQGIDAMSPTEQREPAWVYWKARALLALASSSSDGDAQRTQANELLRSISSPFGFYGKLAAEDLGAPLPLPGKPTPLAAEERDAAARHPGLARALYLIANGLRAEGVREWNWSLRGMDDRALLAAAQRACEREIWDRCINTSERTRDEVDISQRYPMPFRAQVVARAKDIGLDAAYVYGLIRQESRFIMDARSGAGAAGLMQLMPATARWTAKKTGVAYSHDLLTDRDVNLKLGTSYLKLVLDDFGGSQALAAAAYNAGPTRPRKWRDGPVLEAAAWTESIPFSETRDYVKKVLANATDYAALLGTPVSLKARLGRLIGPRDSEAPAPAVDLP